MQIALCPKSPHLLYETLVASCYWEWGPGVCWSGDCSGRERGAQPLHVTLLLMKASSLPSSTSVFPIAKATFGQEKSALLSPLKSLGQVLPWGYWQEQDSHLLKLNRRSRHYLAVILPALISTSITPSNPVCTQRISQLLLQKEVILVQLLSRPSNRIRWYWVIDHPKSVVTGVVWLLHMVHPGLTNYMFLIICWQLIIHS